MMIKEWYHQIKLQVIHMDIKVKMHRFNNIISEIPKTKDRWEYLDQIITKRLVGIPRSNNTQGIGESTKIII